MKTRNLVSLILFAALATFAIGQELAVQGSVSPVMTNDTTTGTSANHLVILSSTGKAVTSGSVTTGIQGIAGTGAGTTGTVNVAMEGLHTCAFASTPTSNHYVQAGAGSLCVDAGATRPTSGGDIIGMVGIVTGTGAGNYWVNVAISSASGSGGSVTLGANVQTASYTVLTTDIGKLVIMNCASACVVTLPASPTSAFSVSLESVGATLATVNLNGKNFNGASTVPVFTQYRVMEVSSDGSNYFGESPLSAGVGITLTPGSGNVTIATTQTCQIDLDGSGLNGILLSTDTRTGECINLTGATRTISGARCWGDTSDTLTVAFQNDSATSLVSACTPGNNALTTCTTTGATVTNGHWVNVSAIVVGSSTLHNAHCVLAF